jgi:ABC-type lipoprotein release transport system permease subunit
MVKIAFRNIFRQKRRTILTVLTMFGGFTLASISIGFSEGSYSRVIDMFTRNELGHIQIHSDNYLDRPTIYKTIDDYREVGATIDSVDGVTAWAPRLFSAGLISVGEKSSGGRVIGIDPEHENETTRFDRKVARGRSFSEEPAHETLLGEGLARTLKAEPGDSLVIVSQAADGSIANDIYLIIGIVESGSTLSDRTSVYLNLADAQDLFVLQGRVHEIAVVVNELDQVRSIASDIRSALNDSTLTVATWQEFASSFYEAMQADQRGSWIMLFVILLVVAVGVLNTVLMTVLERRREYGMLRAVGTSPGQIFRLVTTEVFFMAIIAICLGAVAGTVVNSILSHHGIPMPETITYGGIEFSAMYSEVNLASYVYPGLSVILTSLIVTIFPALRAARIAPARAMRMQ